jgi:CBS domain-containing protein
MAKKTESRKGDATSHRGDKGEKKARKPEPKGDRKAAVPREATSPNMSAAAMDVNVHAQPGKTGRAKPKQTGRTPSATCVRDVMSANVECCTPQTELQYVARMMAERDCGAIPVVDSMDAMHVVGMVTDRDIVVRVVARNQNPLELRAADCMSGDDLLIVGQDMSLQEVLDRMEDRQVRRVPVVDQSGKLTGIVAQADIAKSVSRDATGELVQDISRGENPGGYR